MYQISPAVRIRMNTGHTAALGCSGVITIPKIMILGIVVSVRKELHKEPSFFISLAITSLQRYQADKDYASQRFRCHILSPFPKMFRLKILLV